MLLIALAAILNGAPLPAPPDTLLDTLKVRTSGGVEPAVLAPKRRTLRLPGPTPAIGLLLPRPLEEVIKTVPQELVEYSDLYGIRAELHRYVSWAMIPLFIGSGYTGFQLRNKGDDAPQWTKDLHGPLAGATAVLFGMNTVTGVWNLIEGRKDPEGRGKRILHGVMFLAAGAGFAYVIAEGDNIRSTGRGNHWHRDVALGSMAVSVVSWAMMALFD